MDVIQKVRAFCQDEGLIRPGDTIVVGCSGGPDSLALLDILAHIGADAALRLIVVYVHHGLRTAADQEVEVVRQAASERHCPFIVQYVDVAALATARHQSLETVGRDERYRIFRDVAAQYGAASIAVAHHQMDQAETVLLHLLRGSGLQGLGGMRPRTGQIIRPLLVLTRPDIEAYAAMRGLRPCHDETNDEPIFLRNQIRLEIIPFLKRYNPSIVADLNRLATISQGDEDVLQELAAQSYRRCRTTIPMGVALRKQEMQNLPVGLQRRVLRLAIADVTGTPQQILFSYIEAVRALCDKETGKEFHSRYWQAYTTYDTVCIIRPKAKEIDTIPEPVEITGPGQYRWGAYTLTLERVSPTALPQIAAAVAIFDEEALPFPLWLRCRQAGDSIALPGGTKKIKKFANEQKIPVSLRRHIPLVCAGADVIWICGYAQSRRAAVTTHTKRYIVGTIARRTT